MGTTNTTDNAMTSTTTPPLLSVLPLPTALLLHLTLMLSLPLLNQCVHDHAHDCVIETTCNRDCVDSQDAECGSGLLQVIPDLNARLAANANSRDRSKTGTATASTRLSPVRMIHKQVMTDTHTHIHSNTLRSRLTSNILIQCYADDGFLGLTAVGMDNTAANSRQSPGEMMCKQDAKTEATHT